MSDVLLQNILDEMKGLRSDLAKGPKAAPAAGATTTKPDADKATAAAKAAAAKTAADKKAADEATAKAAAEKAAAAKAAAAKTAGPAAGTKAPGGKYTIEQVREKVREVASNENLGKETASDILDQDGNGSKRVTDLKPADYDRVYEACAVALQSEGAKTAAPKTDDDDLLS
jgi:hypothetical protein